jgi:aldehyde dehydrogenase (NAD+)
MAELLKLFVDGQWIGSKGSDSVPVVNPTNEEVVAVAPAGDLADVELAVQAARRAFETWSGTPAGERAEYLRRIAAAIESNSEEIARLAATDIGTALGTGRYMHVKLPATTFLNMADIIESFEFERREGNLALVYEPVGVVACITPWNYPLHQIAAKIAPALAAGCTVIVKPSEVAPLSAWKLAEIVASVGLPPGVVNFISGYGPVVGEALARHADVDMVSFTGSVRGGTRVAELAASTVKRVTLELGGKSPNVILEDASDLERIATLAVSSAFLNSGQTCSALTRLIVPQKLVEEMTGLVVSAAEAQVVGDPLEDGTTLGPLVSEVQFQRVRAYIEKGIDAGARLLTGGLAKPSGVSKGFFVAPTVFGDVRSDMVIAQEEIFGPVLSVIPYNTEDEAIAIANGTPYGLSGGVWAGDTAHAERVAHRLRTGQVKINGGAFNPTAAFGGYKRSGFGRELGPLGLEEYFQVKALTY